MVWLRSSAALRSVVVRRALAIAMALGLAVSAHGQMPPALAAVHPAKSDNLELRLVPGEMQAGVPQAFTFVLVNISDHDVRVPSTPSFDCFDNYDGTLWLRLKFTPLIPGPLGHIFGCGGTRVNWPPVMDRVKKWKVLHAGESFSISANKDFDDKQAGTYEFWVNYRPPALLDGDEATLRKAGIDYPHEELSSAHVVFVKKPI